MLAAIFTYLRFSVLVKVNTYKLFIPPLSAAISTQPRPMELEATTYTILTGQFSQLFEVRNVWALKYRVTRYIWGLWAIDRRSQYSTESHCEHEPGRLHFDF